MPADQTMPITASVDEAARLAGLSRSTIYKLLREGKISAKRRGRATLVVVATLSTYLLADLKDYVPGADKPPGLI